MSDSKSPLDNPGRRAAMRVATGAALASAFPLRAFSAQGSTIKIGCVSPQTGPLAAFAEPDAFTLEQIRRVIGSGIKVGGRTYAVEIVYKDSQSDSNRAADVTSELILNDKVHLVIAAHTPATTNPVADQCELNGVPCITTDTPWQAHFFGRNGDPGKGFDWTYHFFWGLEDIIGTYTSMWAQVSSNKTVGALWPNDSDGNIWGDAKKGFPPVLAQKGFSLVDKGRFHSPADNFSTYISEFKRRDVAIVTGVVPPPDFANFWSQAGQQGLKPKVVTVAKASEFPAVIQTFGDRAQGLSVEVWWSPSHPFKSSLTDTSCLQLAQQYTQTTSRPWSMPLGFKHALFEVAIDALRRSADLKPESIRNAIRETDLATIVGRVNFSKGPVPNIAKTPLVGGQWKKRGKAFDLRLVDNSQAPIVPVQERLDPLA
ncbi:ABC transporter substrate-binding protein [Pararobbsia silviterrae]|uniref:ABC transporter substrate-binding protein n=1 Tax=Pararobbsia silviterrae TaxID=1792498 RepID=A0A494XHV2_9BURK|nr:ABC transporter substrate-binding protein [Pararobbsia silviterrae]RKP47123.1 ABC transporter substrate-binding protein [Pararobbsia silviterrae]